jgi:hypothetical protein
MNPKTEKKYSGTLCLKEVKKFGVPKVWSSELRKNHRGTEEILNLEAL